MAVMNTVVWADEDSIRRAQGPLIEKGRSGRKPTSKADAKKAKADRVHSAFPQYKVVETSALKGDNIHKLYKEIAAVA